MKQCFYYQVNGRQVAIPAEYAHLIQMKSRKEIAAEYNIPVALLKERISLPYTFFQAEPEKK